VRSTALPHGLLHVQFIKGRRCLGFHIRADGSATIAEGSEVEMADHDADLADLWALAAQFPDIDTATAELARTEAVLTLPRGAVHVISDVHGEDKKLRHVINNASGALRPLIQRLLGDRLNPQEMREFLALSFYPAEVVQRLEQTLTEPPQQRAFGLKTLRLQFVLVRELAARYSRKRSMRDFPPAWRPLLEEMLHEPATDASRDSFFATVVDELVRRGKVLHVIHLVGRLIRNLAIDELILAGDCWDRGPRGDRVVEYLRQQPSVSFVWGNHDASWIGAALGNEALICTILRISLRYRRLSQLDEGYSIPLTPLEHLARTCYADDPATHFMPKAAGLRPMELIARMQKAIAVMQFKLEGQAIDRNPQWELNHRKLLHRIDHVRGTIEIDGEVYPLRDTHLPTVDPANPYELTPQERSCMDRIRASFLASQKLQEHVRYLVDHGTMSLVRDEHLIFHGCVPCDVAGNFLPMPLGDGRKAAGRALFDEIQQVMLRVVDGRSQPDLDLLWYLWSGPRSPLFGKNRIATLERDFIADKRPHHEEKDPYFKLIHEAWFCEKVLSEFGVDPERGLIVNGHVPVKVEAGESPVKRSGKAITIDGAFSEAYGDHGYTLVLEADRTLLAEHHHFDSVEAAIRDGVDIVPAVQTIREWDRPRTVADSSRGQILKAKVAQLERLVDAYRRGEIRQTTGAAFR
jgi:fructose-1,6-bisphosphatase-3